MQDMRDVLTRSNMFNGIDDTANIPPFATVKAQIQNGRPLIICISGTPVAPGGDCIGGHYVIVYGFDESGGTLKISVVDPADDVLNVGGQVLAYHATTYQPNYTSTAYYWGVPYYTKPPI